MTTLTARRDLERKKIIRSGWLALGFGVIVPFFALGAALVGVGLARGGERTVGRVLAVAGVALFTLRWGLYRGWF